MPRNNNNSNGAEDAAAGAEGEAVELEDGNLNVTFPLPEDVNKVFVVGDTEYKFCIHCHTPKPIAQIGTAESRNPGICVNCVNGINNYDKLAGGGLMAARPGWTPKVAKARAGTPRTAKIRLADGTEVEGQLVAAPRPKRARKNQVAEGETVEGGETEAVAELEEVETADVAS